MFNRRTPFNLLGICILAWSTIEAPASVIEAEPATGHAKACNVLKVPIPGDIVPESIKLEVSQDGQEFRSAEVGLPRGYQLLYVRQSNEEHAALHIVVVGRTQTGLGGFLPEFAGPWQLRWTIGVPERADDLVVEQELNLLTPTAQDSDFLDSISPPDFVRFLMGASFFRNKPDMLRKKMLSEAGTDGRALRVIAELLKATQVHEPLDVGRMRGWSEEEYAPHAAPFLKLARDFPDSTYAPYAAYYAGCLYLALVEMETKREFDQPSPRVSAGENYKFAEEALRFAADRGDPYLKPRALYMSALLRAYSADWRRVESALNETAKAGAGDRWTERQVADLHEDIAKLRREMQEKKQDD